MSEHETTAPDPRIARRHWASRLVRLAAWLVAAALVLLGIGFAIFLHAIGGEPEQTNRSADGIVVLTGGTDRVAEAASLLAAHRGQRLLITGVHPNTTLVEIGRIVPVAQAVLDCCAELGREALNTRGNAIETAQWAERRGVHSLIVVTSNWHMPRALVEMRRAMPDVELLPYAVSAGTVSADVTGSFASNRLLFFEYIKFLAAYVGLRPGPAMMEEIT